MSGIILLGTPMEIYTFGSMYWDLVLGYLVAMATTAYLFMPVFVDLQITSVYEVTFNFLTFFNRWLYLASLF